MINLRMSLKSGRDQDFHARGRDDGIYRENGLESGIREPYCGPSIVSQTAEILGPCFSFGVELGYH